MAEGGGGGCEGQAPAECAWVGLPQVLRAVAVAGPPGLPPAGTSVGSSQQTELWAGTAGRAGSVLWTLRQSSARAGLRADYPGRVRPCRGLAASPRDLHAAAGSVVALRLPVSFAGCRPDARLLPRGQETWAEVKDGRIL